MRLPRFSPGENSAHHLAVASTEAGGSRMAASWPLPRLPVSRISMRAKKPFESILIDNAS
jgi:hypothetical protein